jgi:heat shock protein HslJ
MKIIILCLVSLAIISGSGCKRLNSVSSDTSTDLTPKDELTKPADLSLINSRWILRELGGKAVKPQGEVYIRFEDNVTVYGFGGCNKFNGKYATDGADIKIGPLMSTKMTCGDQGIEDLLLFELQRTESYTVSNNFLYLKNDDGVLAKLEGVNSNK